MDTAQKFIEHLISNPKDAKELDALAFAYAEDFLKAAVEKASELGYEITKSDLKKALEAKPVSSSPDAYGGCLALWSGCLIAATD